MSIFISRGASYKDTPWHLRLGHAADSTLKRIFGNAYEINTPRCEACVDAKSTRKPFQVPLAIAQIQDTFWKESTRTYAVTTPKHTAAQSTSLPSSTRPQAIAGPIPRSGYNIEIFQQ